MSAPSFLSEDQIIQTPFSNKKTTQLKMDKEFKYTLLQGRYTNAQQAREKMFNIISHQENRNQNHNEIALHVHWDG